MSRFGPTNPPPQQQQQQRAPVTARVLRGPRIMIMSLSATLSSTTSSAVPGGRVRANAQEVRQAGRCSLVGAGDAAGPAGTQATIKVERAPMQAAWQPTRSAPPPSCRAAASPRHIPRLAGSNVSLPSMSASVITMLPPVALATRLGQRGGAEQCVVSCCDTHPQHRRRQHAAQTSNPTLQPSLG